MGENRRVLHALRMLLEEFRSELRDEEHRRSQLQQAYANEKASWEVQWAELRCQIPQVWAAHPSELSHWPAGPHNPMNRIEALHLGLPRQIRVFSYLFSCLFPNRAIVFFLEVR